LSIQDIENTLETDQGSITLRRWPLVENDLLRAWDAADEYLLEHIAENLPNVGSGSGSVVILNDTHGALATALNRFNPISWSDSYLSHRSAKENVQSNKCGNALRTLTSIQAPDEPIDLLLIRIPKTTALLEDQLARIRPYVHQGTQVVAAGMIKHLQKSAFSCLEKYIGPLTTSLGKKKARLLFPVVNMSLQVRTSPYPSVFEDVDLAHPVVNHANVFSREQLDHGARFLVEQYNFLSEAEHVVDLACGNGILGLQYLNQFPGAQVSFLDESYSSVESARLNHEVWFSDNPTSAKFVVADGLESTKAESVDLILCNPPFHQQHIIGDQVAMALFTDAKRCLRQGGAMWIVANQHLSYSGKLKRLFGNCRMVASNKKFAVFKIVKR
jgi:16S rRNA (guanine1207-N2)-methyltransferase